MGNTSIKRIAAAGLSSWPALGLAAACLALALAWAAPARADNKSVEAALASLAERYQGLASFSAGYSRTTITPSTDPVFKSQASQTAIGIITWLAESRLRLDQSEPDEQLMTTDGKTVWWHIPEEKLVYVYRDLDLAGELAPLMSFMAGLEALNERFRITEALGADAREGETGLILDPRSPRGGERAGELIVYCDAEGRLTGFRLNSPTGEKTDFRLFDQKSNPGPKEAFFVFKPPRGVRVVEETAE
jgi:outer membrane lipoprotein-sorting protein